MRYRGSSRRKYDKIEIFSEDTVMSFMKNIQSGVLASMEGTPCVLCHCCLGGISILADQMLDFFSDMELMS